jgi:hypothetical protein
MPSQSGAIAYEFVSLTSMVLRSKAHAEAEQNNSITG